MTIMVYIVMLVLFMILYMYIMNLEKFNIHFRKQWLNSIDEAQLMKNALGSQKVCSAGMMTGKTDD